MDFSTFLFHSVAFECVKVSEDMRQKNNTRDNARNDTEKSHYILQSLRVARS